jgi:DnaJ family protein A protein 5
LFCAEFGNPLSLEEREQRKREFDALLSLMGADERTTPNRPQETFSCIVCKKKFKSEQQWRNHEQSKKHKLKLAKLREELLLDEEKISPLLSSSLTQLTPLTTTTEMSSSLTSLTPLTTTTEMSSSLTSLTPLTTTTEMSSSLKEMEVENSIIDSDITTQHIRRDTTTEHEQQLTESTQSGEDNERMTEEEDYVLMRMLHSLSTRHISTTPSNNNNNNENDNDNENDDSTQKNMRDDLQNMSQESPVLDSSHENDVTDNPQPVSANAAIDKTRRRRRRAMKTKETKAQKKSVCSNLTCNTCGAAFPSRNALFTHLRQLNHATALSHN